MSSGDADLYIKLDGFPAKTGNVGCSNCDCSSTSGGSQTDTCSLTSGGPFAYIMVSGFNSYTGASLQIASVHNVYVPSGPGLDGARYFEKKCYVLDLAQSTKTWEDFTELPEGSAYHALVYNEKVNRLYSIAGERSRYDTNSDQDAPTWKGTYVYDFDGTGSDVRTWRDMSDGCADDKNSKGSAIPGACNWENGGPVGPGDDGHWRRSRFNKKLSRFQNSVVSYDKYIIIYGFNLILPQSASNHGPRSNIIYLNVETEQWYYPLGIDGG